MSDESPQNLHKVTYEITVVQNLVPAYYDLIPESERTPLRMVQSDIEDTLKGAMSVEELLGSYEDTSITVKEAVPVAE